jgi:hypothetical protein
MHPSLYRNWYCVPKTPIRTLLKLWLLVSAWNKGDNSKLVSAVAYLDTGKYLAWICGYVTVCWLQTMETCAPNWLNQ